MDNSLRRYASTLRSLSITGGGPETKILLDGRRSSAMALYCIGISRISNKSVGVGCFRMYQPPCREEPQQNPDHNSDVTIKQDRKFRFIATLDIKESSTIEC
jgi:hypothetical protein